jgi:hypothetical protein
MLLIVATSTRGTQMLLSSRETADSCQSNVIIVCDDQHVSRLEMGVGTV